MPRWCGMVNQTGNEKCCRPMVSAATEGTDFIVSLCIQRCLQSSLSAILLVFWISITIFLSMTGSNFMFITCYHYDNDPSKPDRTHLCRCYILRRFFICKRRQLWPLPPQQEMHSTAIGSLFQGWMSSRRDLVFCVESKSFNQCGTTDYTNWARFMDGLKCPISTKTFGTVWMDICKTGHW